MDERRTSAERFPIEAAAELSVALGGDAGRERRSAGRRVLPAPIAARVKGLHFARILNISSHGALADTAALLRPLETNELVIRFPGGPFVAQVIVRRCRAWGHVTDVQGERFLYFRSGFQFDSLSPQERDLLDQNIRVLAKDAAVPRPVMPQAEAERERFLAERRLARDGVAFRVRALTGGPPKDQTG